MFLDDGRKLEYPERNHTYTGKNMQTLHRKAPAGIQTRNPATNGIVVYKENKVQIHNQLAATGKLSNM